MPSDNSIEKPSSPLAGLRIVELSSFVATPLSGLVLSQLGAEVVRIEPLGGAVDRNRMPVSPAGTSLYWSGLNGGKRSISVDLRSERGRELVADLVCSGGERGGILVSNTEQFAELSFEGLSARRSDVVHVQLTGNRDGGTGVDYTVQAASGFPLITGPVGFDGPVNSPVPAWDIAAGFYLATGLLAAERARRLSGSGQEVRLALEDIAFAMAGALGLLAEPQLTGESRQLDGNHIYGQFGTDFTSDDGVRFMLVTVTLRQWRGLLASTGLAEAVAAIEKVMGADFALESERFRCRDLLTALLDGWFSQRAFAEIEAALKGCGVMMAAYQSFADFAAGSDAPINSNPLFEQVDQPGVGPYLAPGSPMLISGSQFPPLPAPSIGQHTDDVFRAELGLDDDALRALRESGHIA